LSLLLPASVHAATYILPPIDQSVIGRTQVMTATATDTFSDIALRHRVGFDELVLANPEVDPWLPGEGTQVMLPTRYILPSGPREGIVLNVPEMRLYYYPDASPDGIREVITYPLSIGRGDWETPLGLTRIVAKKTNPSWRPPESIRAEHAADGDYLPTVVPPGPDNPLGKFALQLGLPGYLIHGTNRPNGIGMRVTHGCVRLYPSDIEALFARVTVDVPVRIVHQPYKVGWHFGELYLEAHPPFGDAPRTEPENLTPLARAILDLEREQPGYTIDVRRAIQLSHAPTGIPIPLTGQRVADTNRQ
jgi:L,D-transpeptidase ErfK/SrfK